MKFDLISKISKENSQNYYFCLQFDDWILLKGEKILFGKRLLKKEIMKSGLKFNFWVSADFEQLGLSGGVRLWDFGWIKWFSVRKERDQSSPN